MIFALFTASAVTPDEIVARVEETRALRQKGLMDGDTPSFADDVYRTVAAGGVETSLKAVEGYKAKKALGVGVIPVPIAKLWAAINDDASKPQYNRVDHTEVLEGGLCGAHRVVFMHLPLSMLTNRHWVIDVRTNGELAAASGGKVREMVWKSIDTPIPPATQASVFAKSSMPIEFTRGGWWLTAIDEENTLVEYWTWTDPGGYVPAGIASSFAAGGIKDTFEATKKLALAGTRCPLE